MKYKVMPKKHLTSKVLDLHMHACASAQSDQDLWVVTVEKRLAWNTACKNTYDQQSSRSGCACASTQFEQKRKHSLRKHAYIILTPLKPHFYIVKLGFTGVYINFLISAKIDCGYSLEPPRRGGSNEYPQSMFWAEIWKNIRVLYLKIFGFWRCNL